MKRFLRLLFILFAVSMLSFWICSHTNTDPIEQWCLMQHNENEGTDCSFSVAAELKREEWGLNLPLFYFGIGTWAEPDTLYRIADKKVQESAIIWLQKGGDWQKIQNYLKEVYNLYKQHKHLQEQHVNDSSYFDYVKIGNNIQSLLIEKDTATIMPTLRNIQFFYTKNNASAPTLLNIYSDVLAMSEEKFNIKNHIPKISFFGIHNQYHQWLLKTLQGDFGKSYRTNEAVSHRIWAFVERSALFSFLSFLLALCIAIPLGILKTAFHGSIGDKISDIFIFIINALPTFVIGIFLIVCFANPSILNWFLPAYSYNGTWFERATLPLIAYTIGSANFYTTFIKSLLSAEISQDYIRTARAKGLKENLIYLKHAFKNILVPLLTASTGLLPSLIGGSIALEYVFSIGGMGEEAFIAVQSLDIPMILAIMTITGLLTVLGYMITDSLSLWIDKRIKD